MLNYSSSTQRDLQMEKEVSRTEKKMTKNPKGTDVAAYDLQALLPVP